MTKAEEIARSFLDEGEDGHDAYLHFDGVVKIVDKALEWAAQQAEEHEKRVCEGAGHDFAVVSHYHCSEIAGAIRSGKSGQETQR